MNPLCVGARTTVSYPCVRDRVSKCLYGNELSARDLSRQKTFL